MPYKGQGKMVYLHNELYDKLAKLRGRLTWDKFVTQMFEENQNSKTADLEQAKAKPIEVLPEVPAENKESEVMAGETCFNCALKDRDIQSLKEKGEATIKESEKAAQALAAEVATLKVQLAEKPAPVPVITVDHIGEGLENFIEHCESGVCPSHSRQWADIRQRIMDADGPKLVANTLENIPDDIVEREGLKRGFIPQRIIIPTSMIKRR